jgi:hypothetical protein
MPTDKTKRPPTSSELRIAEALKLAMAEHGFLALELLLQLSPRRWSSFLNHNRTAKLRADLVPIAKRALSRYRLNRKEHIDDAVQQILLKLQEGRCFKTYRSAECAPRIFLMSCAPNYARTIARSIWLEARRYRTNRESTEQ